MGISVVSMPKANWSAVPLDFPALVDLADRSYFRRAKASRASPSAITKSGGVTERGSVNFGYLDTEPLKEVNAVVFAALDLVWLTQLTGEASLPEGASLSILDSQGIISARFPDPEEVERGNPCRMHPYFRFSSYGTKR